VWVFHHSHAIIFPSWHPGVISWCCGIRPFIIHVVGRPRLIVVFYVTMLIPFFRKWAWFIRWIPKVHEISLSIHIDHTVIPSGFDTVENFE